MVYSEKTTDFLTCITMAFLVRGEMMNMEKCSVLGCSALGAASQCFGYCHYHVG